MAISRLRFAPFLLLVLLLAATTIVVPEASAYRELVSLDQIVPDDDGGLPAATHGGGSASGPLNREKTSSVKKLLHQECALTKLFLQLLELVRWSQGSTPELSDQ